MSNFMIAGIIIFAFGLGGILGAATASLLKDFDR